MDFPPRLAPLRVPARRSSLGQTSSPRSDSTPWVEDGRDEPERFPRSLAYTLSTLVSDPIGDSEPRSALTLYFQSEQVPPTPETDEYRLVVTVGQSWHPKVLVETYCPLPAEWRELFSLAELAEYHRSHHLDHLLRRTHCTEDLCFPDAGLTAKYGSFGCPYALLVHRKDGSPWDGKSPLWSEKAEVGRKDEAEASESKGEE